MALTKISGDLLQQPIDVGIVTASNGTFSGNLNVAGVSTFQGNVYLGDNVNIGGEFISNLVPNTDDTYDIGVGDKRWRSANFSGISTFNNVTVGGASTALLVNGNARIVGVLTIGTASITFSGVNNQVTGITTFTGFTDFNEGINVDGHTELDELNVTGVSTFANTINAVDASFSGNVSIAGTLTYDDVTNVDSIGIITARRDVLVGGILNVTGISTFNNTTEVKNSSFKVTNSSASGQYLQVTQNSNSSLNLDKVGDGAFYIRGNNIYLQNDGTSETYAGFEADGKSYLNYNGSTKLETTGTGVTITGDARVTGILTVGTASVTIDGSQDFPTIRPTLDLNFAATKTLDRRITFTRDSIGTYIDELGVIKYAPNNVPRFDHDPDTGESLGLLIEESRTNSYTYSVDLSQSVYSKNNVTIVSNAAVAPDGTTTATKIVPSTSSVVHSISRIGTVGLNAIRSVYIKAGEYTSCVIDDINTGARATINLLDGSTSNTNYIPQRGNLVNAGNGWWRVYVGYDQYSAVNNPFHIYPNTNSAFAGDGTSGIYVWGYQQEADAWPLPSSYIPTSGSTVTRAQDFAKITGTNFTDSYNQEEGTLVCDQSVSDLSTANQYSVILSSSINESIGMGYRVGGGASGDYGFYIIKSGDALFRSVTANIAVDTPFRTALAYKLNDGGTCFNGGTAITDDTLVLPTPDRMLIGEGYSANNELTKGHIRKLTYYPKRLTNAQLQSLTRQ